MKRKYHSKKMGVSKRSDQQVRTWRTNKTTMVSALVIVGMAAIGLYVAVSCLMYQTPVFTPVMAVQGAGVFTPTELDILYKSEKGLWLLSKKSKTALNYYEWAKENCCVGRVTLELGDVASVRANMFCTGGQVIVSPMVPDSLSANKISNDLSGAKGYDYNTSVRDLAGVYSPRTASGPGAILLLGSESSPEDQDHIDLHYGSYFLHEPAHAFDDYSGQKKERERRGSDSFATQENFAFSVQVAAMCEYFADWDAAVLDAVSDRWSENTTSGRPYYSLRTNISEKDYQRLLVVTGCQDGSQWSRTLGQCFFVDVTVAYISAHYPKEQIWSSINLFIEKYLTKDIF